MNVRKLSIRAIAPPAPTQVESRDDQVWLLNLDQIEPHSGRLLSKQMAARDCVGASTHAFDSGNVLYSKLRPYLNKVFLPEESGFCTTELVPLRPNPSLVRRDYLAAYLRSPKFLAWVNQQVDGAKMPRVSMKVFWEHELELPSLEEQKRIAAILDKADSLRRKRQQAIRLAGDFIRAVFLDMFGDPVTNPKGLPKLALGEMIKLKSGEFLPSSEMSSDGSIPVYGGNGINGYHDEKMFDESQIVIGRVGAYCGAVHQTEAPCWVTDNALYVAEKSPDLHSDYLLFALRQANLNQYASQSGQPLVSGGRIYPVEILVPDMPTQNKFAKIIQRRQALSDSLVSSEMAAVQLGKSLQSNFF